MAATRRAGFERLLGAVALGEVELILSRELSRLVRTDRDFCQLVELCQLFATLVGDEHTIYDVSRMDDQLVLGIKATMSVVELEVLRMRLLEGKENKAKRGALYPRLPSGYVWGATRTGRQGPQPACAGGDSADVREVPRNVEHATNLQALSRWPNVAISWERKGWLCPTRRSTRFVSMPRRWRTF